jgi:type IV pilus assembly protein PilX
VSRSFTLARVRQRGVSLLFALLALAAISLAAVALVRSVDSGTLVIGNLGFKQDATSAADLAAERARTWLMQEGRDLGVNDASEGYYATAQDALDPTGRLTSSTRPLAVVNWGDSDSCACVAAGTCLNCSTTPSPEIPYNVVDGNPTVRARYLITRLCPSGGAVSATNACAQPAATALSEGKGRGEVRIGTETRPSEAAQVPYYRIIVRTVSGRNTVSFTETVIY